MMFKITMMTILMSMMTKPPAGFPPHEPSTSALAPPHQSPPEQCDDDCDDYEDCNDDSDDNHADNSSPLSTLQPGQPPPSHPQAMSSEASLGP